MNWIKRQINRFKIWIGIATVVVAPLAFGALPDPYAVRQYECHTSEQVFLAKVNDPTNPQNKNYYADYKVAPDSERGRGCRSGYFIAVYLPIGDGDPKTDGEALDVARKEYPEKVQTVVLRGQFFDSDVLEMSTNKNTDSRTLTLRNDWSRPVMLALQTLVPPTYAAFPTENFDSYSVGDLVGSNGGTGWSASWGEGALACTVNANVGTGAPVSAPNNGEVLSDTTPDEDGKCRRQLASAQTTDGLQDKFTIRVTGGEDNRWAVNTLSDTPDDVVNFYVRNTGQLAMINNVTFSDLQAYDVDTNYAIIVTYTFSTESVSIKINGSDGAACTVASPCNTNSYLTTTDDDVSFFELQDGADVNGRTFYVDDIGGAAAAAGGAPKVPDSLWWD